MQAVRGGSIVNGSGKNITVSAEGSAYGMMAISGSNGGKNFTDVESAVDNRGSITVTAGDTAYGIYSTVKGDVKNSGKITINGAGYGIFNQNGSVNSSGSIIVAGTGEKGSYGIYAEAEAGSGNKITNAADITMTFAPEEEGGDDEEEQPTLPPTTASTAGTSTSKIPAAFPLPSKTKRAKTFSASFLKKAASTTAAPWSLTATAARSMPAAAALPIPAVSP